MEKYVPDIYQKSIYTIDYDKLAKIGIKCLLLDLDNTLIPSNTTVVNDKLRKKIKELKKQFHIVIFSNALEGRVKKVANELDVEYQALAFKPLSYGFNKILNKYKYKECEVAIVGDQLQTDILGGNNVGIVTILVNPISTRDSFFTKINRWQERRKMNKMYRKGMFTKGRYYE